MTIAYKKDLLTEKKRFQILRRADEDRCSGLDELRFVTKAPGDRDTVHPGISGGLQIDFRISHINTLVNGQADLGSRCQDRVRRGFAADRGTLPDGEFQKPRKERIRELLNRAIRLD